MARLLLVLAAPAALVLPARAAAQAQTGERDFDIPAQPLARAIAAFSHSAQIGIAFDADEVAGRRSAPVRERTTPQAALRKLLEPTGLTARFTAPDSAIIFNPHAPSPASAAASRPSGRTSPSGRLTIDLDTAIVQARRTVGRPDPGPFFAYARRAQDQLQDIFARDPAFRDADFSFRVAVSLDASGRIATATLSRPSGVPERDRRVVPRLLGHDLGAPPAGLVQPLTFEIVGALPLRDGRRP